MRGEKNTTAHAIPRIPSSAGRWPSRRDAVIRWGTPLGYQANLGAPLNRHWILLSLALNSHQNRSPRRHQPLCAGIWLRIQTTSPGKRSRASCVDCATTCRSLSHRMQVSSTMPPATRLAVMRIPSQPGAGRART